MDWENKFRDLVLGRGHDYYISNRVKDFRVTNKWVSATVIGNTNYDVKIKYNKNHIIDMFCTCPYATKGNHCKHMAAVLFEWDECRDDYMIEDDDITIEEALNQATEKQIKDFLLDLFDNDNNLALKFKTMVNNKVSNNDMRDYKKKIDDIRDSYMDYGMIDYYHAFDFMNDVIKYLKETIDLFKQSKCYYDAFDLYTYAFETINDLDMDDSGGEKTTFVMTCVSIWDDILEMMDETSKDKMFQWFIDYLEDCNFEYLEDYLEEFLMDHFKEDKYLHQKLDFTKQEMENAFRIEEFGYYDYIYSKWSSDYYKVMIELNTSKEEIEQYYLEHYKDTKISQLYISYCIDLKQYNKAIAALNQSIEISKSNLYVTDYRHQLKDIYHIIGNNEEYKKQLMLLVTINNPGDVDDFKELKALYDEKEWLEVREDIFMILSDDCHIDKLYKEEKLYNRLLDIVLNDEGLDMVFKYEDVLKDKYSKELLEKYTKELNEMAYYSASRDRYRQWVQYLRRMKKIDGGEKVAQQIADDWKVRYKNRPAMMDELGKL
ncbi:MAG: hypothetical protein LUG60_04385 [Erysipelotrichaceae bacterium]|nr:hypothetical protein [Erysipelotrichaceae bacterium]